MMEFPSYDDMPTCIEMQREIAIKEAKKANGISRSNMIDILSRCGFITQPLQALTKACGTPCHALEMQNFEGQTPLTLAAMAGNVPVVEILLEVRTRGMEGIWCLFSLLLSFLAVYLTSKQRGGTCQQGHMHNS